MKGNRSGSLGPLPNLLKRLTIMKIKEQIREGIVELAPGEPTGAEFYLSHKTVLKESAESTKLRIVYDASARPDETSPSLNECLERNYRFYDLLKQCLGWCSLLSF